MKTLGLMIVMVVLFMPSVLWAEDPKPPTTEVLELKKQLVETQIQNLQLQFVQLQQAHKDLSAELEKRQPKAAEASPAVPEKK